MLHILFIDVSISNPLCILFVDGSTTSNTWFLSEFGSDDNDCHSEFTQCRNLQTVLERATDGADIYVTSRRLPLLRGETTDAMALHIAWEAQKKCPVDVRISFSLRSAYRRSTDSGKDDPVTLHCPGYRRRGRRSQWRILDFPEGTSTLGMGCADLLLLFATVFAENLCLCIYGKTEWLSGEISLTILTNYIINLTLYDMYHPVFSSLSSEAIAFEGYQLLATTTTVFCWFTKIGSSCSRVRVPLSLADPRGH